MTQGEVRAWTSAGARESLGIWAPLSRLGARPRSALALAIARKWEGLGPPDEGLCTFPKIKKRNKTVFESSGGLRQFNREGPYRVLRGPHDEGLGSRLRPVE